MNIHLYAIFVPGLIFILLISPSPGTPGEGRGEGPPLFRHYTLLLAGTSAACLMTPFLPGVLTTAWHYQFHDLMVAHKMIAEMQPFYRGQLGYLSASLVAFVLLAAIINPRNLRWPDRLLLLAASLILLRLGRFAPIFAILAVPTLSLTLPPLKDSILSRPWLQSALALVLLTAITRVALSFPTQSTPLSTWLNRHAADSSGYPTTAADYVQSRVSPRTHRLISEFTWGGYLEWRLGRNWQLLMDGRTQLFSDEFWRSVYLSTPQARKTYLAGITADAAILPARGSAFDHDLMDLGWKVVWSDEQAQVLLPPPQDQPRPNHIVAAY